MSGDEDADHSKRVQSLPPEPTVNNPEVQVYKYDASTGAWVDEGSGVVGIVEDANDLRFQVLSITESDGDQQDQQAGPPKYLVDEKITASTQYNIEGGSGITFWSMRDESEKAISFDSTQICTFFWSGLVLAQYSLNGSLTLPDRITLGNIKQVITEVEGIAAVPMLASWVNAHRVMHQLMYLFHVIGDMNPEVTSVTLHHHTLLIHSLMRALLKSASQKIIEAVTLDHRLWYHYTALEDYATWSATANLDNLSEKPTPELPCPNGRKMRLALEEDLAFTAPIPWCHSHRFRDMANFQSIGEFSTVDVEPRIHQTVRVEYLMTQIILPQNEGSAPIPTLPAVTFTGGGEWGATVLAMKGIIQDNQVYLVHVVGQEDELLEQTFRILSDPSEGAEAKVPRLRFLNELFALASTSYQQNRHDLCAALSKSGLFQALFQCLADDNPEMALLSATLLDKATGMQASPCTDGTALLSFIAKNEAKADAKEGSGLLLSLGRGCVSPHPNVAEAAIELTHRLFQLKAKPNVEERECGGISSTPEPPTGETDDLHFLPTINLLTATKAASIILPMWEQRLGSPCDEAYHMLCVINAILERNVPEVGDLERRWNQHMQILVSEFLVKAQHLAPGGCIARLVEERQKKFIHLRIAAVKAYRCLLRVMTPDVVQHFIDKNNFDVLVAVFLEERGMTKDNMLASAILGVFNVLRLTPHRSSAQPLIDHIVERYKATVFSLDCDLFRSIAKYAKSDYVDEHLALTADSIKAITTKQPRQPSENFFALAGSLIEDEEEYDGQRSSGAEVKEEDVVMEEDPGGALRLTRQDLHGALMDLEEVRIRVLGMYQKACKDDGVEPSPPHLTLPPTLFPEITAVEGRALLQRISALTSSLEPVNRVPSPPETPNLSAPPRRNPSHISKSLSLSMDLTSGGPPAVPAEPVSIKGPPVTDGARGSPPVRSPLGKVKGSFSSPTREFPRSATAPSFQDKDVRKDSLTYLDLPQLGSASMGCGDGCAEGLVRQPSIAEEQIQREGSTVPRTPPVRRRNSTGAQVDRKKREGNRRQGATRQSKRSADDTAGAGRGIAPQPPMDRSLKPQQRHPKGP
eukprot:Sspe_Gene.25218::Locus_10129_Transcript_1_1_Confidence_1.000_Length_3377::g.25218::m.25218/K17491/SMEK, PPP4R3; protein phosphatase 4 regulatory subunit 3